MSLPEQKPHGWYGMSRARKLQRRSKVHWPELSLYKLVGALVLPVEDFLEWAIWFENAGDERIVGRTEVGPVTVSTVFLGLDHGWEKKPLLFETMIFGDKDKLLDLGGGRKRWVRSEMGYACRYTTYVEAEEGHRQAVTWAQEQLAKLDAQLGLTP